MKFIDSFFKKDTKSRSLLDDLADFYRENKGIVFTYFLKVTGSRDESEELTQETFYQAVKSIHTFKELSSLKTWLLKIAKNVYRNKVRKRIRDEKLYSMSEEMELKGDESQNPLHISLQNQIRDEIQLIFQKLHEDYRDVLIFKEIEGLSHEEIAQILGKSPKTTKVLLYRAKQKFKELYDREVLQNEETM